MAKHFLPLIMAVAVAGSAILVTATAGHLAPAPTVDQGNSTAKPTVYEMLERYGFAPGILPAGAGG